MGRRNRSTGLSAVEIPHKKHIVWCEKHDTVEIASIFFVSILNAYSDAAIKVPNIAKISFI